MAAMAKTYDILLLGRTGMGKSATGNHLVESLDERARIADVLFEIRNKDCRGKWMSVPRVERRLTKFVHASGKESCTTRPDVLHNLDTGIQVMDTKGFADSNLEQGISSFTNNLGIMRSILIWQSATGMAFRRVLYFLPSRTPLERLDGNLQEEIDIMLHFFGAGVFNCMVLVFTLFPGAMHGITPAVIYGDNWESMTKDVILEAIKRAAKRREVNLPEDFECPPVVFIPKAGPSDDVIRTVKRANVLIDKPYSFAFRKTTCVKCAASLKFPPSAIAADPKLGKGFTDPVTVKYDNDSPIEFAKSMCHPNFVSKYSFWEKLGGSFVHIASLGMLRVAEIVSDEETIPFFGNSEEVCVACKKAPSKSRGCEIVNTYWKPKNYPKKPSIKVSHCSGSA